MPEFVPGLKLARGFYAEVVAPLLVGVRHSAARLGWGSDVLGFDDDRSTDHGWGPRLQLFVEEHEAPKLASTLDERLPEDYRGWPVRFGWDAVPVMHHVEVTSLSSWLVQRIGVDPRAGMSVRDWLVTPQQRLLEVTAGAVFHDGLGQLQAVREALAWYPDELWVWLLGCQWRRLAQEEAFIGRAAERGDDLGSRVVTARLVRDLMRLCFLLARRYAPYSKWLGTAFRELDAHRAIGPALEAALAADGYAAREAALAEAVEEVARRHNALGITGEVDANVRLYYGRPFRVLMSDRFADACFERVSDPLLSALPPIGSVDQFVDSTDVLSYPARARRARAMYEPDA